MNTNITISLRVFPVTLRDERTGETVQDDIIITREQLQAAGIVGLTSTDLIYRAYNRHGFKVLTIDKPTKRTVTVGLTMHGTATDGEVEIKGDARLEAAQV